MMYLVLFVLLYYLCLCGLYYSGYIFSDIFHYDKEIKLRNQIKKKDIRIKFLKYEVKNAKNQQLDNG